VTVRILQGDCREVLRTLDAASVHCSVTSPPYFGLRDYGVADQIGLEPTPAEYVEQMVAVFREVRRVLRDDGTLWLNLGDSYAGSWSGNSMRPAGGQQREGEPGFQPISDGRYAARGGATYGLKPKDLIGIPWRVAFALQADGWYLRQDIIWSKPNPMPESVRDRCTKAHEYVFLLSKSERYWFDAAAIAEPVALSSVARLAQDVESQAGSDRVPGKTNGPMKAVRAKRDNFKRDDSKRAEVMPGQSVGTHRPDRKESDYPLDTRNKRSVWAIATQPFSEAHFATMAPELAETCIKAGCPQGGAVLDPFGGAGTTGLVADRLQRDAVLCELNPEYIAIAQRRIAADAPLFAEVTQ
jgi:DNA modification methylase